MIALIDNYDSFTFNLYHLLCQFSSEVYVYPNDKVNADELMRKGLRGLIFSPGPGVPEESGKCQELLEAFSSKVPILGVCLGMQLISLYFGARYRKLDQPNHGIQASLVHQQSGLFQGIQDTQQVGLYHSLEIVQTPLFDQNMRVDARDSNGTVMAISHRSQPIFGVQFHPESVLSPSGEKLIGKYIDCLSI